MRAWSLVLLGLLSLLSGQVAAGPYPRDRVDKLQDVGMEKLKAWTAANPPKSGCTLETAIRRREWSSLSNGERTSYINAVKCLASKPSKYSDTVAPGAKSRYDDFVVTHIQQTLSIHLTASFLPWHRYYVWAYEKALREECNYDGYQPYWHWPYYAADPLDSPIFNGNETSMSGNGEDQPHPGVVIGVKTIPPAGGGGCLTNGPFKDFKANLGPVSPVLDDVPKNPSPDGLGYNPRCLRRDVNKNSAAYTTEAEVYDLITGNDHIYWFQTVMQGDLTTGKPGVHGGGHYTISGDPAGDFYNSPADPAFWLHHGMVDRTWWIWQMQDLSTRLTAISGGTRLGEPSANGTVNDSVELNVNAPERKLGELLDTLNGPFCYIYV